MLFKMERIEEFIDERNKAWCIHCGGWIGHLERSRDHVPSKSLLQEPYPAELPMVTVCGPCNRSFSLDEEYLAAFLGSVLSGSTEPDAQWDATAKRILTRSPKLRARIERSKIGDKTRGGDTRLVWKPEQKRVNRVIMKNARGHAFFEHGEPMLNEPTHIWSSPLLNMMPRERATFEGVVEATSDGATALAPWPEVGSRMMTRLLTGQGFVDGWVVVQEDVYRHAVVPQGRMTVRTVLREYLATEVRWDDD